MLARFYRQAKYMLVLSMHVDEGRITYNKLFIANKLYITNQCFTYIFSYMNDNLARLFNKLSDFFDVLLDILETIYTKNAEYFLQIFASANFISSKYYLNVKRKWQKISHLFLFSNIKIILFITLNGGVSCFYF